MLRTALLLAVLLASTAASLAAPGDRWPLDQAPPRARDALKAFQSLGGALQARLQAAMKEGGPVEAIAVCRVEAPKLTGAVAAEQRMRLGRTAARLRNPANAPRAWVEPWLATWAGRPAREAPVEVVDLGGGRLGVIAPIPTGPLCVTCHGKPGADLQAALRRAYPDDRATGFQAGDLRGAFWAELEP